MILRLKGEEKKWKFFSNDKFQPMKEEIAELFWRLL